MRSPWGLKISQRDVLLSHTTALDREQLHRLAAGGVELVIGPVGGLDVRDDRLRGVHLEDGRRVPLEALAVGPRLVARSGLVENLGGVAVEHPSGMGTHVPSDEMGAHTGAGVWVAGNTEPSAQVIAAAAQGTRAGAAVNADLVEEDLAVPAGVAS